MQISSSSSSNNQQPANNSSRTLLTEIFETGQEVFWLAHTTLDSRGKVTEARVPAKVVSVDRANGLVELVIELIHSSVPFWVGAGSVRAKCIECRLWAAMPYSHICVCCWHGLLAEELEEEEEEAASRLQRRRQEKLRLRRKEVMLCQG